MPERLPELASNPIDTLRATILSLALSKTALTGLAHPDDTTRRAELYPLGTELPTFRIMAYQEGSQMDGTIVQISFETDDVDEGHLMLAEDVLSYYEASADGTYITTEPVDAELANHILEKLRPILS